MSDSAQVAETLPEAGNDAWWVTDTFDSSLPTEGTPLKAVEV